MVTFFDDLVRYTARSHADRHALIFRDERVSYAQAEEAVARLAGSLQALGLARHERVAVFLPKTPEHIYTLLAASRAGGVFVPVNSVLKPPQVQHILSDCAATVLVTSHDRLQALREILPRCESLQHVIVTDRLPDHADAAQAVHLFTDLPAATCAEVARVDNDMAAILYTSGSTGMPKGVILSHRNIVCGAQSVAQYLGITDEEVILALLPLSFDYGLNQVTTSLLCGATCVLMDYLLPGDVVRAVAQHRVTGLAAVPPLWQQLMRIEWPDEARTQLRYFTNSGGAMPLGTLRKLRETFVEAQPVLMYGLTEAFRSTYLPPSLVDDKPGSMGKAIPNAEIMVVRSDGTECGPGEPGELVHRGPLVSLGYWNDPARTAQRFKPAPSQLPGLVLPEIAVWSGDTVKKDEEGYLYFVGRRDEMIKTSGYRVSPMEVETGFYEGAGEIAEVVACGVPDSELGQAIVVLAVLKEGVSTDDKVLLDKCKRNLPNFMHPKYFEVHDALPRNPNGKVDRSLLARRMQEKYGDG